MASELEQTIARIREKSHVLTQRYATVRQRLEQANDTIAGLRNDLEQRDKQIDQLRLQVQYLTLASTIAPDRQAVESTRAMLTQMVRDIDRCIADLAD